MWKRCWNELSPKVRGAVGEPVILGEWMSLHIEDCVLYGFTMLHIRIYIYMFISVISESLFEHSVAGDMMA